MSAIMMLSRELRQVPLDFDWPLNKVWHGYQRPEELILPKCPDCEGQGYSPEARHLYETFYAHNREGVEGWHNKLSQDEVDHLLAEGRLRTRVPDANGGSWQSLPRSAEEVNRLQTEGSILEGHDGINCAILVRYRCEKRGIPFLCQSCDGSCTAETAEQRQAHDAWSPFDPPQGAGIQLWETVSEGSPISPVFPNDEDGRNHMAEWLCQNERLPGAPGTLEDWQKIVWEVADGVSLSTNELC